jgi:hypothetical protein
MISNRETHDFRYRIIRNRAPVYIHQMRAQYFPKCAEFYSKIGCARAADTHAAAPPRSVMKCRRLIQSFRRRREQLKFEAHGLTEDFPLPRRIDRALRAIPRRFFISYGISVVSPSNGVVYQPSSAVRIRSKLWSLVL